MPRYFFQTSGAVIHVDHEGRDLPDIRSAWSMAIVSTGELLRDVDGGLPDHAHIVTTVTDADGQIVISLHFHAQFSPVSQPRYT